MLTSSSSQAVVKLLVISIPACVSLDAAPRRKSERGGYAPAPGYYNDEVKEFAMVIDTWHVVSKHTAHPMPQITSYILDFQLLTCRSYPLISYARSYLKATLSLSSAKTDALSLANATLRSDPEPRSWLSILGTYRSSSLRPTTVVGCRPLPGNKRAFSRQLRPLRRGLIGEYRGVSTTNRCPIRWTSGVFFWLHTLKLSTLAVRRAVVNSATL